jgi:4,5-DOPA dioxygenase extradiol
MEPRELDAIADAKNSPDRMPVLFLGHGNPMNAIEENEFVAGWRAMGATLPRPRAILCISAHWETRGTFVTAMEKPKTIHDFGGFPEALYEVQYPAPGDPKLAQQLQGGITTAAVGLDEAWGLDHGCWSVVKHLYPAADVPVIQMSLDRGLSPRGHYELAKELAALRSRNVLIIGSGNMVHNLRMVAWDRLKEIGFAYDWALEVEDTMRQFILNGDHRSLIDYQAQGKAFQLAVPTPDHYLPLLYALALQTENERVTLFNDKAVGGSLTMTSLKIDKG